MATEFYIMVTIARLISNPRYNIAILSNNKCVAILYIVIYLSNNFKRLLEYQQR